MRSAGPRRAGASRGGGRVLALLCVLVLTACSLGNEATTGASSSSSGSAAPPEVTEGPTANGPVPTIVVDQFGYRLHDSKVAVLREARTGYDVGTDYRPGKRIELVDAATGAVVRHGSAKAWDSGAEDAASGDRAWWFDFSKFDEPGSYFVRDAAGGQVSATFAIGSDVYEPVVRDAVRTFFYQRAGQEKPASLAGESWADGASHLGPGQDTEARSWLAKDDPATARDLRGGWYDAGDFNKYTAWHAGYLVTLLHAYRLHPGAVGDDLGIPESGNGTSDLLDEILWGLDWLERAQDEDGSLLSIEGLSYASPPSAATGRSYYGPPTTYATTRGAAAFALAATVLADSDSPARDRVAELTRRAEAAWAWAAEHPDVVWYNNDDERQPGSGGLGAGQQEVDDADRRDARVAAAVYLYGATGDAAARSIVESQWQELLPPGSQSQWTVDKQETLLYYAALSGVPEQTKDVIRGSYRSVLTSSAALLPAITGRTDPYRAPMQDYTWGSNGTKAQLGRLFVLAQDYGFGHDLADEGEDAAAQYLHYLHGVNPLGLVYLTNMGSAGAESSATTLYHHWFAEGTRWDATTAQTPGPAPGFLVGGPNPHFTLDECCAGKGCKHAQDVCKQDWEPPLDQPAMKSYLQFNDGWPANSWEITENSNGYQVAYLRLLLAVADGPGGES